MRINIVIVIVIVVTNSVFLEVSLMFSEIEKCINWLRTEMSFTLYLIIFKQYHVRLCTKQAADADIALIHQY